MAKTSQQRRELLSIVNKFYAQPVARVSFELFITIGVIMFFAVFAIRPTLLTMSDLIKEIEDKRKLDQALTQKVAALSSGQTEYLNVQPRLPILDSAIPPEPRLVEALKILEKIASDQQIAINGLQIPELPQSESQTATRSASANPTRQDLNFVVSVVGDYARIKKYIDALQATQRVIIVESITFTINEDQGDPTLVANINLNMPYFGADKAAAPATRTSSPESSL